ncbi:hypothetical protein L210DRAFT_986535 [Boletus edulis BED1]|uniref:Uncharacterized protein n=1 Tax=Boletus edulis BED1 TaxID=1328754 RepID=A0AAD4BFS4_BOLED|nr:hypothetical protein L210DRAFT_986535 [Boletus edulis BED1]
MQPLVQSRLGLTQHQYAKHPRVYISPPSSPLTRSDSPPTSPKFPLSRSPTPQHAEDVNLPHVEAEFLGPRNAVFRNYHPLMTGRPCGSTGASLPPGAQPPPLDPQMGVAFSRLRGR